MHAHARAFTLLDAVIAVGIAGMLVASLGSVASSAVLLASIDKTKAEAVGILTAHMEALALMPYATVGTLAGTPQGSIPESVTEDVNGFTYTITTSVAYLDDTADGSDAADADAHPEDYKTVRITVSWEGPKGETQVSATTYRSASL